MRLCFSVEVDVLLTGQGPSEPVEELGRPLEVLSASLLVALDHELSAVLDYPYVLLANWEVRPFDWVFHFNIIHSVRLFVVIF